LFYPFVYRNSYNKLPNDKSRKKQSGGGIEV